MNATDDKGENLAGEPGLDATTSDQQVSDGAHRDHAAPESLEQVSGRDREHDHGQEQGWSHRVRPSDHVDGDQRHENHVPAPDYVADDRPTDRDLERPADDDLTQVHELHEPRESDVDHHVGADQRVDHDQRLDGQHGEGQHGEGQPLADQRRDQSELYRDEARSDHDPRDQDPRDHDLRRDDHDLRDDRHDQDRDVRPAATGGAMATGAVAGAGAAQTHDDLDQPTQEFEPVERRAPVREPRGLERRDDYFDTNRRPAASSYGDEPTAQYDQGLYRDHNEHTQVMEGVDGTNPDDEIQALRGREAELQRRLDDAEARRDRAEGELERQRNLGTVTPSDQPDPVPARPVKRITDRFFGALGLFLLRLVLATALGIRGYQVVTNTAATEQILGYFPIPRLHLVALCCGVAMIVGAVCLLFGFLTRVVGFFIAAASIAYLVMIVWGLQPIFSDRPGYLGEYFVLLAASGLLLLFLGAGGWSIDGGLRRSRASRKVQEV